MKQYSSSNVTNVVFSSVENIPGVEGSAAFTVDSSKVFRDDNDIAPITLTKGIQYMPWGGDNNMPYRILDLIESDETLSTCQMFNAEICYGSGLKYNTENCTAEVKGLVSDFLLSNALPTYFLGVCQDFKHFGWCASVLILDREGTHIVGLHRKEVCYCRYTKANDKGVIEHLLYGNFKKTTSPSEVEVIPLLDMDSPWQDLKARIEARTAERKFAVVCRIPTPDSTYYPIPYYASLFKGK